MKNIILSFSIILTIIFFSADLSGQQIVINEVNYRSVELQQNIEFVEIYNNGPTSVDLTGWQITGGISYQFPGGTTINSDSYLVIAADPDTCQVKFGFSGAVGPYIGGLSNGGDNIELRDPTFCLIDKADYKSWQVWPNVRFINDGDSPASIQKINPKLPSHHGGSWSADVPTPMAPNTSVYVSDSGDTPVIEKVSQVPEQPVSGAEVVIKAHLTNLDTMTSSVNVLLEYQVVEPGNYIHKSDPDYLNNWQIAFMTDDGVAPDVNANNGTFSAAIPASAQQHRHLIRYRITISTSSGYSVVYPDQNHTESNYSYYIYDSYPLINGYDLNTVTPLQEVTVITGDSTSFKYMGPGNGTDNTGQYTGFEYLGEGTLIYNGQVYDHVRFRPRGRTNGRSVRFKPGVKFDLNSENSITPLDDCNDKYEEDRGKFTLSGTYVNDRASHGLTESLVHKILNLVGAMGRGVDYTQLRVVDGAADATDNTGDFWGVFLILENYDGDYLKEHGLPDGNIWRYKRAGTPAHRMTYQGDFPGTDTVGDWQQDMNKANWDLLLADKVANQFFANGANNYEGKHAQRDYYDAEIQKWHVWYGDYDGTFGMTWDDGTYHDRSASQTNRVIKIVQDISSHQIEYENKMRSAYDLLFNTEQANYLVDMESRMVYDPSATYDWTVIDRSRWNQPYDLGNIDAQINWYKTWFQDRGNHLVNDTLNGFKDIAIPDKPTISLSGSNALDDLTFSNANFSSPASATFAALEWRVGEWSNPANPTYATICEPIYEIEHFWTSGEITNFSNSFTIPGTAGLTEGRTYKIRVRYKDNTGRWSHWSDAIELIPTAPNDSSIPDLVINEVMYHQHDKCGSEFIEIKNTGSSTVALDGYRFTYGVSYDFPNGSSLAPGDFIVLAKDSLDFYQRYGFSPFGDYEGSLSNDGEKINFRGLYNKLIDSLAYSDANPWDEMPDGQGPSLELMDMNLDSDDPFAWFRSDDECGTPNAENSRVCTGIAEQVVINEINYNPPTSPNAGDWVELHNTSTNNIDLSGWEFYDNGNQFIIPNGTFIEPDSFLILTQNDTLFTAIFPHVDEYLGNFDFNLSGGGERISLFDENKCLSDFVIYDDDLPWDTIPDGNGPSLSLITPDLDNSLYTSWESSSEINSANGTPGRPNTPCLVQQIVAADTVCIDTMVTLTVDIQNNNTNYEWIGGASVSNNDSLITSWSSAGTYNIVLVTNYFECTKIYNKLIVVEPCNATPLLADDTYNVDEDNDLSANLMDNDYDPDGHNMAASVNPTIPTNNGSVTINSDGTFDYVPDPNFNGSDSFEYEICDDGVPLRCETAVVNITVNPVNDSPVALDDNAITQEDNPVGGDLSLNDSDLDGDDLIASGTLVSPPANGTATIQPDGMWLYTPDPDFNGNDSFVYEICDDNPVPICATATIFVTIDAINDAPVAVDDNENVMEDNALTGSVVLNDSDVDGTFTINTTPLSLPSNGTVVINNDGTYTYTPNPNFNGADSFKYEICDDGSPALCNSATVIIDVTPVNDTPVALDDNAITQEDNPVGGDLSLNDSDLDGDNLIASGTLVSPPANGTAIIQPDGMWLYTPDPNFNGNDSFVYEICDDNPIPICVTATVFVIIDSVNDAPVAMDDSENLLEDTSFNGSLVLNDNDVDGTFTINTTPLIPPSSGILVINNDGTYSYTPDPNSNGNDSFVYEICDDGNPSLCSSAIATMSVIAVNDAPIANDDNVTTQEDIAISQNLANNDIELDGENLEANTTLITAPSNGSAFVLESGLWAYTPNPNFNGMDSFEYEICDDSPQVLCDIATIYITVEAVNDAPVATNDNVFSLEDLPLNGDVLPNDTDVEGGVLTVTTTPVTPPQNGTLVLNADGSYTYTPNTDYNGADSFTYEVCDDATPALCDMATVNILIDNVNDAPLAEDDFHVVLEDGTVTGNALDNDSDKEGDNLIINTTPVVPPSNGTVILGANGICSYTPDPDFYGTDTFQYVVCDSGIPPLCDTASITILVEPVNDAPVAVGDTIYLLSNEDIQDNVLGNDTDVENDILTATTTPLSPPVNGSLVIDPNGNIDYVPDVDFIGEDQFTYEVCDGDLCSSTTVTLRVAAGCVDISLNVMLEGVYDDALGEMRPSLSRDRKLLPGQTPVSALANPTPPGQPYNVAPWNYNGIEGTDWTDAQYTEDEIDWLLISFRRGISSSTEIAQTAAVLFKDGHVEFPDQCALLSDTDSIYIVVEHRNHMGIMSPTPLPIEAGVLTYDFTTADSYRDATSFGQKQLPNGVWFMYAGDGDQAEMPSYDISGGDKASWLGDNGFFNYYIESDYNLDGDINGADKVLWSGNNGISSRVPK